MELDETIRLFELSFSPIGQHPKTIGCDDWSHNVCEKKIIENFFKHLKNDTKTTFNNRNTIPRADFVKILEELPLEFIKNLHSFVWRKKYKEPSNWLFKYLERKWIIYRLNTCKKERKVLVKKLGMIGIIVELHNIVSHLTVYSGFMASVLLLQRIYHTYLNSNKHGDYVWLLVIKIITIFGPFLMSYSGEIRYYLISGEVMRLRQKNNKWAKAKAAFFFSPAGLLHFFLIYNLMNIFNVFDMLCKVLGSLTPNKRISDPFINFGEICKE